MNEEKCECGFKQESNLGKCTVLKYDDGRFEYVIRLKYFTQLYDK